MAEKLKLNKVTLRAERQRLELYSEFLPTLELRKLQLLTHLRKLGHEIEDKEQALQRLLDGAEPWAPMLKSYLPWLRPHVVIESVQKRAANVAGVSVPIFGGVQFSRARYSLLGTPPFFDTAVEYLQRALAAREELKVLREQQERLQRELTKTTQRINLYQEVLIPEARDNIHRIRVYLGDQYTAAVCRAKIAKDKLLARGAAQRSAT